MLLTPSHSFGYFAFFNWGSFVNAKTFHDFTICFIHIHSQIEATFSFDLKDVYSS